jgi:hypothetical protein
MKFMFTAYACEVLGEGPNRSLIPGAPISASPDANPKPLKKGDRIRVQVADGSYLDTIVLNTRISCFEPKSMPFPLEHAFTFCTPEVAPNFRPKALDLGAKVFLIDGEHKEPKKS